MRSVRWQGTGQQTAVGKVVCVGQNYVAHIEEHRCPAGVCKALIRYDILEENCVGCGACRRACPVEAISGDKKEVHVIDQNKCIKCGMCMASCRFDAVTVT